MARIVVVVIVVVVTLSADPERIVPVFASGFDPLRLASRIEHAVHLKTSVLLLRIF